MKRLKLNLSGVYSMLKLGFFSLFISFILISNNAKSQSVIGVETRYNDTFREWLFTSEDDEVIGEIRMRWSMNNDWTEWDINLEGVSATVKQKWKDDPQLWEIQCGDDIVNARTAWPGEFLKWKLSDSKNQFTWGTKYTNNRDEWIMDGRQEDLFKVATNWDGDPREWTVVDNLPDDVSMAMRIGLIFLAIHFSTPKF